MTSFSSILSSLGEKSQNPQINTKNVRNETNAALVSKAPAASDRFKLSAVNTVAGVKRKAGDVSPTTSQDLGTSKSTASRFQLSSSSKSGGTVPNRAVQTIPDPASRRPPVRQLSSREDKPSPTTNIQRQQSFPASPTAPAPTERPSAPKKGFASILEKAKAAQAASQSVASGGIKHKPVERLSRKERFRLNEEIKARQKQKNKSKGKSGNDDTPKTTVVSGPSKTAPTISYKGTMKAAQREVSYKGTIRAMQEGGPSTRKPQKGLGQDKYGGYASWSDLDEAEDEEDEEGGYGTDESDDMEGGFDDLQEEEATALREARREDQAAQEEEDRLQREKAARRRKLEEMNKAAASRRRY